MRNGKSVATWVVLFIVLISAAGCAMTPVRQHPDFASGKRKVQVVAILPPDVEYRHLVFTGENERDPQREQAISQDLANSAEALLQARGYSVKTDLLKKLEAGDKQFNFEYEQLKGAYAQASKELYAQPMVQIEESNKFKVGLGSIVNPFAAGCGADALLLARYAGFDKSGGLIAKEVIGSALLAALTGAYYVPAKNGGSIEVALIDGITGEVLWSNSAGGPIGHGASLNLALTKLPAVPAVTLAKPETQKAEPEKLPQGQTQAAAIATP